MTDTPDLATPQKEPWPRVLPWAAVVAVLVATVFVLHELGRVWWCTGNSGDDQPFLWVSDVMSMHNSQHLVDPYSFSHFLHGLVFTGLFACIPLMRKKPFAWRLVAATILEASWEIFENTPLIINRYREATIARGYTGDSIGNSLGDIACCLLGFAFASSVRWYWSLAAFITVEMGMLLAIRDNLSLNVLMLLWPIDAVRQWQSLGM